MPWCVFQRVVILHTTTLSSLMVPSHPHPFHLVLLPTLWQNERTFQSQSTEWKPGVVVAGKWPSLSQSASSQLVSFFSLLSLSLTRSFKFEHPCSPGISQGILHCIMWWEEGKRLTHCLTQHCTHMHPHIRNTRNNYFTLNFDALKLILLYIWRLKSHIWEPLKSSSSASCERFFPSLILPIPLSNTIIMSTKYSQHGKYHWRCTQLQ